MMDNCLVLPQAQAWSRLQAYLSGWRKAILLKREHNQMVLVEMLHERAHHLKAQEERLAVHMAALQFQKAEKIVLVEMLHERAHQLEAQEDRLVVHMAALQFQKAEKIVRALEAYAAIPSLQTLLVEELRMSGSVTGSETANNLETQSCE
ncbi:UNVERIFIED_CONTAM: hypothetical protein FKN15_013439 [Acipenser sinensis]